MKYLILNPMMGTPETSIVSSMKIAVYLRDLLKAKLITGRDKELKVEKSDILFFINASTTFSTPEMREFIPEIISKAKCCVYVQNDYLLVPRPLWRNACSNFIWWSIVQRRVKTEHDKLMNFNVLTYNPIKLNPINKPIYKTLFYYGSCRPGRVEDFSKYFGTGLYDTVISASSHVAKRKFGELKIDSYYNKDIPIVQQIVKYPMSIYLMDKTTVRHSEMPANRFYEVLSARRAMVFDAKAVEMFRMAGYDISKYVVTCPKDVKDAMKYSEKIAKEQWKNWSRDYVGELTSEVRKNIKYIEKNIL